MSGSDILCSFVSQISDLEIGLDLAEQNDAVQENEVEAYFGDFGLLAINASLVPFLPMVIPTLGTDEVVVGARTQPLGTAINGIGVTVESDLPGLKDSVLTTFSDITNGLEEEFLSLGIEKINVGDYEAAIEELTKAIDSNSKFTSAYFLRGYAFSALEEYHKADSDYTQTIQLDPTHACAFRYRGNIRLFWSKDYKSAIADYSKFLEFEPDEPNTYFNRANAYLLLDDYANAIADYIKVTKLNPSHVDAYFLLGRIRAESQDYEGAVVDFSEVIKIHPIEAEPYYHRGNAYYELQKYQHAIADFNQAIVIDDSNVNFFIGRGNAHYQMENYDQAIADFTQAIELTSNSAEAYFIRGCMRNDKGDIRSAIADYTQAINIDPEHAYAYVNRGNAFKEKGKREEAITDFTKAIVLFYRDENSMREEILEIQQEIHTLENEIENLPWWQKRIF